MSEVVSDKKNVALFFGENLEPFRNILFVALHFNVCWDIPTRRYKSFGFAPLRPVQCRLPRIKSMKLLLVGLVCFQRVSVCLARVGSEPDRKLIQVGPRDPDDPIRGEEPIKCDDEDSPIKNKKKSLW